MLFKLISGSDFETHSTDVNLKHFDSPLTLPLNVQLLTSTFNIQYSILLSDDFTRNKILEPRFLNASSLKIDPSIRDLDPHLVVSPRLRHRATIQSESSILRCVEGFSVQAPIVLREKRLCSWECMHEVGLLLPSMKCQENEPEF